MLRFENLGDLIDTDLDLDKIAIIDLGTGAPREFTYRQMEKLAAGVARALTARKFARGDRVAILSANRAEFIATMFGIMRAGFVAVPVNFKFPRETIDFIVRRLGARLVFCDPERRADCPPDLPVVKFGDEFDTLWMQVHSRRSFRAPREPAMILYTSGSTGVPKGVVLSHQSHLWVVKTRLERRTRAPPLSDRGAALSHERACVSQLAAAAHATIVLLPQFTAAAYIDVIERYRCTWLTAVPPMIAMMLREGGRLKRADLSSVGFVRMGSAPVSEALMAALKQALPKAAVTNAYGTTEGGPVVFGPHPKGLPQAVLSVGYPHPEVQVRLMDCEGRPASEGVLEMKAPALMNGYHNRPDLPSPIRADGFYITGDVFRRDENGFQPSSGGPTTCSSPAVRTSIQAMSSACSSAIRISPRPAWCRSRTRSRGKSPSPLSS